MSDNKKDKDYEGKKDDVSQQISKKKFSSKPVSTVVGRAFDAMELALLQDEINKDNQENKKEKIDKIINVIENDTSSKKSNNDKTLDNIKKTKNLEEYHDYEEEYEQEIQFRKKEVEELSNEFSKNIKKIDLPNVIIITGGSRGIGKAIVKQFSNSENKIYFTYKNSEKEAKEIEQELSDYNVFSYKLDISVSEDIKTFIEYVYKKENKIDILINNAGITDDSLFLSMSDEKWLNVINTNLNGTFFITKETVKYMMRKKQGKIINISSIVASKGNVGQTNYSASKAGIEGMTRSFALELGSRGITVNSISLGFVLTDMTKKILENSEKILSLIPLNRFCQPEEVAEFIYLFSSLKSNYITGQTINIDGGLGLLKF